MAFVKRINLRVFQVYESSLHVLLCISSFLGQISLKPPTGPYVTRQHTLRLNFSLLVVTQSRHSEQDTLPGGLSQGTASLALNTLVP